MTAWNQMYRTMNSSGAQSSFSKETARRILSFAAPHRRALGGFLVLSVALAVLAVATPVLAGRVVNAIVDGRMVPPPLADGRFNSPHGITTVGDDVYVTEWLLGGRWVRIAD